MEITKTTLYFILKDFVMTHRGCHKTSKTPNAFTTLLQNNIKKIRLKYTYIHWKHYCFQVFVSFNI